MNNIKKKILRIDTKLNLLQDERMKVLTTFQDISKLTEVENRISDLENIKRRYEHMLQENLNDTSLQQRRDKNKRAKQPRKKQRKK